MKRVCPILLIVFLFALVYPVFSQENKDDIYVKTVPIIKIYSHRLGYKIIYIKSNQEVGAIYVPIKWFTKAGGKGEIVWGDDPDYPYFSIFWRNGKFDFIRIYVKNNLSDPSWGVLEEGPDVEKYFDIEELNPDF